METSILNNSAPNTAALRPIYERRAVRKYQDRQVDDEIIEQVLDAGRMAPSAMNKQSWKFYILTHKDSILSFSKGIVKIAAGSLANAALKHPAAALKTLLHFRTEPAHFTGTDPIFHGAPVVIFITAPRDSEWAGLDTGTCAQNMMLAAKSLGLDSCPVGFARYAEQTPVYHKLGIPQAEKVELAVIIGYGGETPDIHPRIKDNAIFVDRMECC